MRRNYYPVKQRLPLLIHILNAATFLELIWLGLYTTLWTQPQQGIDSLGWCIFGKWIRFVWVVILGNSLIARGIYLIFENRYHHAISLYVKKNDWEQAAAQSFFIRYHHYNRKEIVFRSFIIVSIIMLAILICLSFIPALLVYVPCTNYPSFYGVVVSVLGLIYVVIGIILGIVLRGIKDNFYIRTELIAQVSMWLIAIIIWGILSLAIGLKFFYL